MIYVFLYKNGSFWAKNVLFGVIYVVLLFYMFFSCNVSWISIILNFVNIFEYIVKTSLSAYINNVYWSESGGRVWKFCLCVCSNSLPRSGTPSYPRGRVVFFSFLFFINGLYKLLLLDKRRWPLGRRSLKLLLVCLFELPPPLGTPSYPRGRVAFFSLSMVYINSSSWIRGGGRQAGGVW